MKKLTAAATVFLAMLIALPLMTAAFVVSSAPAVAQTVQCTTAGLPPTGAWRPPFQQAYAVSPRGFGLEFHPIYHQWRQHTGQDMSSLPDPGPVVAAARGTITSAGPAGGYGNLVVLDHGAGVSTYYAHLASILLDANPDTQAAITRTKQIYKQVGDRIERLEPSQASDILAVDPSLAGNIPLLQAVASEAGIRILGKTGDSAKMRSDAAKEAVAALKPFMLEVNGRSVAAGALASNRDADREVAGEVMSELMTSKVNEINKADARQSRDVELTSTPSRRRAAAPSSHCRPAATRS